MKKFILTFLLIFLMSFTVWAMTQPVPDPFNVKSLQVNGLFNSTSTQWQYLLIDSIYDIVDVTTPKCVLLISGGDTPSSGGVVNDYCDTRIGGTATTATFSAITWGSQLQYQTLAPYLRFDLGDDTEYITIADKAGFSFDSSDITATGGLTIAIWVKTPATFADADFIVAKYNTAGTVREYNLSYTTAAKVSLSLTDETNDKFANVASLTAITANTWYLIIATYVPTDSACTASNCATNCTGGAAACEIEKGIHIYINGIDDTDSDTQGNRAGFVKTDDTTATLNIGIESGLAAASGVEAGVNIGMVLITKEPFTAAKARRMYEATRWFYGQ